MKIIMMLTADYAYVDGGSGKLYVLGEFRSIMAKQFPVIHPRLSLVVKIEGELLEHPKPKKIAVTLTDVDGVELLRINGMFELHSSPLGIPSICNLLFELNNLQFQQPGDYRFYAQVADGEIDASTLLQVAKLES